jgi:type I restriction enzyme R subunit
VSAHGVTESVVEDLALEVLASLGWTPANGPTLSPGGDAPERESYEHVVFEARLRAAVTRLNPKVSPAGIDEALRRVLYLDVPGLLPANRTFHKLLVDGVEVEVQIDGLTRGEIVRLVDFDEPKNNDWLAVNQLTVVDGQHNRRPDVVLFVNGLPLGVIELKNATDENATTASAWKQLQTYKAQIPSLLSFNSVLIVSDGMEARIGALSSIWERFQPWRTVDGKDVAKKGSLELETLLRGVFDQRRFLDLVRGFTVFEDDGGKLDKKLAGYHQFHAVREAVAQTARAAQPGGDRRVGVVWHTQGSGKSLTMAFYAGRIVAEPAMQNPTLVILTDRNDLDDQLFQTFARCKELLRQNPVQASDRDHLRELLKVAAGGVIFTTIQKFLPEEKGERFPVLTDRRNVVVIADEAHRSQYGFKAKVGDTGTISAGFAQHLRDALPNASFIGFTGTPIELEDKSTRSVFGDYISVYDIQRAVEDGATVPIYYEGRLAKLALEGHAKEMLDEEFDDLTEGEEDWKKDRLKSRWAALEAIVGERKRVEMIAKDLLDHFDKRNDAMPGKAMIVCMSRRICVELYDALCALRPSLSAQDDLDGELKVVMTGSASDPAEYQRHIRNKPRLKELANRFRDPADPLKLVIVRDMWLTGFDAPCLHTMYIDKPMQGHGLMQAIARVNRVFRDKPGGLVVDYIGLADSLQRAIHTYTHSGGTGDTAFDVNDAVAVMQEKLEVCRGLFGLRGAPAEGSQGFDVQAFLLGSPTVRLKLLPLAAEHIFALDDGRDRLVKAVLELSKAHALCSAHEDALVVRDEIAFYQAVKAAVAKSSVGTTKSQAEMEQAIRQIVSKAIATDGVVDLFDAVGLKKPNLAILSDEFLAEVQQIPHKHLAAELLRKLLHDELRSRKKKNLVQSQAFSDMLEKTVARYRNRAIQTVEVIEELIHIAKDMKSAAAKGRNLNLTDDELAFYDALATNDSAVQVLGDSVLTSIARELTDSIRKNVTIDWTQKETVRAKLRTLVRRKLRQYGYPPDLQERAVETVLKQAELLAAEWAA